MNKIMFLFLSVFLFSLNHVRAEDTNLLNSNIFPKVWVLSYDFPLSSFEKTEEVSDLWTSMNFDRYKGHNGNYEIISFQWDLSKKGDNLEFGPWIGAIRPYDKFAPQEVFSGGLFVGFSFW